MNHVIIAGRMGKDPESRTTGGGTTVVSFSLATTRRQKNGDEWETVADWHQVVVFGQQGEFVENYGKKGAHAVVRGRISYRSWEDADGNKRHATEIVADEVELPKLGEPGQGRGEASTSDRARGDGRPPAGSRARPVRPMTELAEDIPF